MFDFIVWTVLGFIALCLIIHLITKSNTPGATTSYSGQPTRQPHNIGLDNHQPQTPSQPDRPNIFFNQRERPDGFHRKFVEHEPIAGASHYQPAYEKLYATKNAQITLLAEPDNKFDPNAIAVKADIGSEELHLGYLSRKLANRFSQQVPPHVPTFARLTTIIPPNNGKDGGARIEVWLPRRDLWGKLKPDAKASPSQPSPS